MPLSSPADKKNHRPPTPSPKKSESVAEVLRKLGPYLNIGYMFVASVLLGTYLGWLGDRKWGTTPWLTLAGAVLGIVVGFYNFFRVTLKPPDESNSHESS